jgi:hypothetical protein
MQCSYHPPPGSFTPRVAWKWTGSKDLPGYDQVLMTPVVIPLSASDLVSAPAVVFNSMLGDRGAGDEVPAVMRAVSGLGGAELWTSDPAHLVNGLTGIAAGDLLGDGQVEFVTGRLPNHVPGGQGLIAFDNQGRFLWELPGLTVGWGAPAIANLFGGKEASIVIGSSIVDAHGKLVCSAQPNPDGSPPGVGSNFMGPISAVADVDLDGVPEIITGNAVYGTDCKPKPGWPNGQLDGLVAVADFIGSPHPQIVVVSAGTVRIQDWTGKVIWGPELIPGASRGSGGPPTVADFDGDGHPEIGVAGASSYTVFKPFAANPVLWTRATQDHSAVTGSSVFDFEHDGKAEVVYADECYLRVYAGPTGEVLFETPNPSSTTHNNPIVADVDRDGRAEIVVPTDSSSEPNCPWEKTLPLTSFRGLSVFKDLRDHWVSTRSVWNQHTYHVTNVGDDGSIPWPEPFNWSTAGLDDFRMNVLGTGDYRAPDLVVTDADLEVDNNSQCNPTVSVQARVWNLGAILVAPGVPVAFYQDQVGGKLLGVAHTQGAIQPGQSELVTFTITPALDAVTSVVVNANDDGTGQGVVGECDATNDAAMIQGVFCRSRSL